MQRPSASMRMGVWGAITCAKNEGRAVVPARVFKKCELPLECGAHVGRIDADNGHQDKGTLLNRPHAEFASPIESPEIHSQVGLRGSNCPVPPARNMNVAIPHLLQTGHHQIVLDK